MPAVFTPDEQRLLNALDGRIQPVAVAPGYGLALALVALLMVLLPVIYLGMIAGTAWLWWWYATHAGGIFSQVHGRGALIAVVIYLGPLVIGGVLILFMFKPLFAGAGKRAEPFSVDERRQPLLVAFIRKLCTAVGAPEPRRIDVTCEVNASASFRRGMLSMAGNDLVLTIGLPLVAGQDIRQFAGVLAHEFGHFAQGWAMRLNYIVRSVNGWFARVVYQRDAWDEWLVETANSDSHWAINVVLHMARLFVWATRGVLWMLMMVGHLFSSLLSRQMEFDADRHAARLVGREPFASALRELPVLAAAEQGAHADLGNAWREKRLADDLPLLIRANKGQIAAPDRQRLINDGLATSAGMYASHPATRDRIAAGAGEPERGVFAGVDGPAEVLFRDFPGLCRQATIAWYSEAAGLQVRPQNLVPTSRLVEAYEREQAAAKAVERLIGPLWSGTTLFAPRAPAETPANAALLSKQLEDADTAVTEASRSAALVGGGPTGLIPARAKRGALRDRVARAAAAAAERLAPAIGDEADSLRTCLATLATHQEALDELREGFATIAALFEHVGDHQDNAEYIGRIRRALTEQRTTVLKVAAMCSGKPYPFAEKGGAVTDLGAYLLTSTPAVDDPEQIMGATHEVLRGVFSLHSRALGRLAVLAG